jgi:hypothetical protein
VMAMVRFPRSGFFADPGKGFYNGWPIPADSRAGAW